MNNIIEPPNGGDSNITKNHIHAVEFLEQWKPGAASTTKLYRLEPSASQAQALRLKRALSFGNLSEIDFLERRIN